ncbi:sulfatase-like hydrolase/transferase [Cesiribacter sp. SM1]|uniref:sulfatase-like hydrolase/transferase n=1 Tax=Cesiribacter sp. SM1 TaxID=2861196 RepID=UPI001CD588CA|nr:sulfatase-like hydrolase/transferase [Cesiribacter sp. SM1]
MYACSDDSAMVTPTPPDDAVTRQLTENVIVVVIDGPRFSETWGLPGQSHIPYMSQRLAPKGTFFSNFQNEGYTLTLPGHTAILTGNYEQISNDGSQHPLAPSVLQHYLKQTGLDSTKAAIISSKAKLKALADTQHSEWSGRFQPMSNCGNHGRNRSDAETLQEVLNTIDNYQPHLMMVQFSGPDAKGHANNWPGYLYSIKETDSLVYELWNYIQQHEQYKDKTALLITNDHGRHADGHIDGFVNHGDRCESCKHISLLAIGPEFDHDTTITTHYEQTEIPVTISKLLRFNMQSQQNKAINPLLRHL